MDDHIVAAVVVEIACHKPIGGTSVIRATANLYHRSQLVVSVSVVAPGADDIIVADHVGMEHIEVAVPVAVGEQHVLGICRVLLGVESAARQVSSQRDGVIKCVNGGEVTTLVAIDVGNLNDPRPVSDAPLAPRLPVVRP